MRDQADPFTLRAEPCWTLRLADGRPAGFEDEAPHFDTEQDALQAAASYRRWGTPAPGVHQFEVRCATAIAFCGCVTTEDDLVVHWPGVDGLREYLTALGYRFAPDGTLRCCPDDQCAICDAETEQDATRARLLTPLPGQLTLVPATGLPEGL